MTLLVACDGTRCHDGPSDWRVSNVVRIKRLFDEDRVIYREGPGGTDGPIYRRAFLWLTGLDCRRIGLSAAREVLERLEEEPDAEVYFALFSRGWVVALVACEELRKHGVPVRAMVGLDAIFSLGIPLKRFDWIDRRYPQEPPDNVSSIYHLVAEHEDDVGFYPHLFDSSDERIHQARTFGDHGELGRAGWARWWMHATLALEGALDPPSGNPPLSYRDRWGDPLRDLPDWLPEWRP